MKRTSFIIILLVSFLSILFLGLIENNDDEIKKRQSELEKLRGEINKYEQKIKDQERKEHTNLELLDSYDRQVLLLRKLIKKLREDEQSLRNNINNTKESINNLSGQITFLKNNYANYVKTLYKNGRTYDLELLISSKSLNQALIRSEYLKRFSEQRVSDLGKISEKRDDFESRSVLLQQQLIKQRQLIAEKAKEEAKLSQKMKKRKLVLADIKRDKKNYQREMNRKLEAVKDLEQLIFKLIEQERVQKEQEAKLLKKGKVEKSVKEPAGVGGFEIKRGQLPWPVSQGKIIARFGNQQHPVLRTITQNTGIDISVPIGTKVKAVADGEISKIHWLPSYGNLVILNHNNGYLTVYAHLSEISVEEKQKVSSGEQIGKSGESISGPMLHFELYKGREKQDPEHWLNPRGLTLR